MEVHFLYFRLPVLTFKHVPIPTSFFGVLLSSLDFGEIWNRRNNLEDTCKGVLFTWLIAAGVREDGGVAFKGAGKLLNSPHDDAFKRKTVVCMVPV